MIIIIIIKAVTLLQLYTTTLGSCSNGSVSQSYSSLADFYRLDGGCPSCCPNNSIRQMKQFPHRLSKC